MTHTANRFYLTPAMRAKLALVVASVSLIVFLVGLGKVIRESQRGSFVIPDEKAVAAAMLEKKLSGPGYFSASDAAADRREPKITVDDAKAQVARVVAERHLDAERAAKLNELIDRLSEPATSRVVGEATVNLLRLNLALDAQR